VRYARHVFVCTHTRAPGGKPSCGARGSDAVVAALQRAVAASPRLVGEVAVTPCGCLGPCFDGPVAVVYPDGAWLAGVATSDVDDVIAWLGGGPPVARLAHAWPADDPDDAG
jgi:(2Fe-2S) ferredoxin